MTKEERTLLGAWAGMIAAAANVARSELIDPNNSRALVASIFHSAVLVRDEMDERPGPS